MASILDPQIKMDVDGSIIDCNWYYGCLLSPRKIIGIHAILSVGGGDDDHTHANEGRCGSAEDDRNQHSIAENDARNKQIMEGESSNRTNPIFGSCDWESAEVCKEDDEEAECFASMFKVLDEDGDGRVSADEIMRFLERLSLGMANEEVELAVRSVSACGDDFLTTTEFAEFYRTIFGKEEEADNVRVEEQAICEAFGVFDQNGDGFISAMELADVLCRLGFVEGRDVDCCQSMIETVDCNGDGFVDIHEFRHLMTRTTCPKHPHLQCVAAIN